MEFDDRSSPWHTVCEIRAPDRPGLLHGLAAVLAAAGIDVQAARVTTEPGLALGIFEVTNRLGAKLTVADKDRVQGLLAAGGAMRRRRRLLPFR